MTLALCALPGSEAFAERLRSLLGADTIGLESRRFPDGESYVRLTAPCAGRDVALVCTLNDPDPKVMALLFAARTARELGATRVGLVAPYLSYMRQDHRFKDGEAITSAHFAALISETFDWLVTVDPHLHRHRALADVYRICAHAVSAAPALAAWIRANVAEPLVVGPDAESEQWAAGVAAAAGAPHVVLSKTRHGDRDVAIEAPSLARWQACNLVLVDDIISSAHTMATAARVLARHGMRAPVCAGVHAIFAPGAVEALRDAGISRVVTTNTVRHETNEIDVAPLVALALDQAGARPGA